MEWVEKGGLEVNDGKVFEENGKNSKFRELIIVEKEVENKNRRIVKIIMRLREEEVNKESFKREGMEDDEGIEKKIIVEVVLVEFWIVEVKVGGM